MHLIIVIVMQDFWKSTIHVSKQGFCGLLPDLCSRYPGKQADLVVNMALSE